MGAGNEISKSKYGIGFLARIVILIGLLGTVGFSYYNDVNVVIPHAEKTIKEAVGLLDITTDDGFGIPKDKVQETIGFAPSDVFNEGPYYVETYKFKTTIPIKTVTYINAVYEENSLIYIIHDKPFELSDMKPALPVVQKDWSLETLPSNGVAGAGQGGGRQQPLPKTPEAMDEFAKENAENASVLNQVAWGIVTKIQDGDEVSDEMIDAARAIADLAVSVDDDPNILDTQAHLAALQGNLDEAIEIQEVAVKNAQGNSAGAVKDYLEELMSQKNKNTDESKTQTEKQGASSEASEEEKSEDDK